jgi:hypothetical protein
MKKITLLLFCFLPLLLAAQTTSNLKSDSLFFREKAKEYDKWLKASGLGKVLRVQTVFVKPEVISLDLVFTTENLDSIKALWKGLKKDFQQQDRGVSLEKELYYKMLYFMEIQPSQGYVQVYDTYNPLKNVCFRRSMAFLNNAFIVDSADCKTQTQEFIVESVNLSNLRAVPKGNMTRLMSKEAVFHKIMTYVEKRFKTERCTLRFPKIDMISTQEELYFRVTDLCKEVLTDEINPWWCSVLEPACSSCQNCTKREMLEMRIKYAPTSNGYQITVITDAKFGSGWYREVKRGAYKNMELDYRKYVEEYSKKFRDQLLTELKKP